MIEAFCFGFAFGFMTPYILHRFVIPVIKKRIKDKVRQWK